MKIAINIEFIEGSAPKGTGTQVYALRLADILSKNNDVTIFTHAKNNNYISIYELFDFYKLSSNFKRKVKVEFYGTNKVRRKDHFYKQYSKALDFIKDNYDLFIQGNAGKLNAPNDIKSVHLMHFPPERFNKPSKLNTKTKEIWNIINEVQNRYINSYDLFLCNSKFTQKAFHQLWGNENKTKVLHPPVFTKTISDNQINTKNNIIATVGRINKDKHVLEMAETFAKLSKLNGKYKFVILGQVFEDKSYYDKVKLALANTKFEIIENPSFNVVLHYLTKAKIYWHAKGHNEKYKYKLEHFGMSTVEAMARGCVPVVINGGGQIEIVNKNCGFRWDTLDELLSYSLKLMNDEQLRKKMAKHSIKRSNYFNTEAFSKNLNKILLELLKP